MNDTHISELKKHIIDIITRIISKRLYSIGIKIMKEISSLNKCGIRSNFSKVLWESFQEQVGNILEMHF